MKIVEAPPPSDTFSPDLSAEDLLVSIMQTSKNKGSELKAL